jgi:hypothetical protein
MKAGCLALLAVAVATAAAPARANVHAWGPIWTFDACLSFEGSAVQLSPTSDTALAHLYSVIPSQAPLRWAYVEIRSDDEANLARDAQRMLYLQSRVRQDVPRVVTVSASLGHRNGAPAVPSECGDGQVRLSFPVPKQFFATIPCLDPWQICRVRCQGERCELRGRR